MTSVSDNVIDIYKVLSAPGQPDALTIVKDLTQIAAAISTMAENPITGVEYNTVAMGILIIKIQNYSASGAGIAQSDVMAVFGNTMNVLIGSSLVFSELALVGIEWPVFAIGAVYSLITVAAEYGIPWVNNNTAAVQAQSGAIVSLLQNITNSDLSNNPVIKKLSLMTSTNRSMLLDSIQSLIVGPNYTSASSADITTATAYSAIINNVEGTNKFKFLTGKLSVVDWSSITSAGAKENFAEFLSLYLNIPLAFSTSDQNATALLESLYPAVATQWLADQSVPQGATLNFSSNWVADRLNYLQWQSLSDFSANANVVSPRTTAAWIYTDQTTGRQLTVLPPLGSSAMNNIQNNEHQIIFGSTASQIVNGGNNSDSIYAGGGNDTINGGGGKDYIEGGSGNDLIYGGDGNDKILVGSGNTSVDGRAGDDTLIGGSGNDTLKGGDGNDSIVAGNNSATLVGGNGNDTLLAGSGSDILEGDSGNNILIGCF